MTPADWTILAVLAALHLGREVYFLLQRKAKCENQQAGTRFINGA